MHRVGALCQSSRPYASRGPRAAYESHGSRAHEPGPRQLGEGWPPQRSLRLRSPWQARSGRPQVPGPVSGTRSTHQAERLRVALPLPWGCVPAQGRRQRRGSYTDVLGQGDHSLVTFDPRGGLEQRAGRRLALRQWPQVWEVRSLATELPRACGQREPVGLGGPRIPPLPSEPWGWANSSTSRGLGFPVSVIGQQLPLSHGAMLRGGGVRGEVERYLAACAAGPPPGGSCRAPPGAWGAPCHGPGWGSSRG